MHSQPDFFFFFFVAPSLFFSEVLYSFFGETGSRERTIETM